MKIPAQVMSNLRVLWLAGLIILSFIPYPFISSEIEAIPFNSTTVSSETYEAGTSQKTTAGIKGSRTVSTKTTGSVIQRIIHPGSVESETLSAEVTSKPQDEVITKGTKKYQYMWCSDGGYRFFSEDQFKNTSAGFTSRSEDYCSKNGQGHKVKLADGLGPRCQNVTSYDYNWDNDMYCTRPDGSHFYTNYEEANAYVGADDSEYDSYDDTDQYDSLDIYDEYY